MIKKVISVSQMAAVLGISFVIDKEGFRTFLVHSLGWDAKVVDAEFKSAGIH